jgi:hypothetical protein
MKEYKSYKSDKINLSSSETGSTEIKIYKDFIATKIKMLISDVNPEDILLEIENYLPVTNYKMLVNEIEPNVYNYILSVPKRFPQQDLIINITNKHSSDSTDCEIFLEGYEITKREIEFDKFNQAKVKTVIDDLNITAGNIDTSLIHTFDEDILIDEITKYFVTGNEKHILFNIRNEINGSYLFDKPINLAFINTFITDKYDLYNPVFFKRKDTIRFYIQNIHISSVRFNLALHGRELKKDDNKQ